MAVHVYRRIRPKEIDCHERLGARTLFRRRVRNAYADSEVHVVQNAIHLVTFPAKHQVVEADVTVQNTGMFK
jgi:hypothetical protein